jgi:Cu+-exporting ATPase
VAALGLAPERIIRTGPDGVARVVRELRDGGVTVAVAGDESSWAAVLAQADLGIAIGRAGAAGTGAAGPHAAAGTGETAGTSETATGETAGNSETAGSEEMAGTHGTGGACLLACGDVLDVAGALALARATRRVAGAGARWGTGYNVIVVPVAALGGLSPVLAAGAAAVTTALVLASDARLRRWPWP